MWKPLRLIYTPVFPPLPLLTLPQPHLLRHIRTWNYNPTAITHQDTEKDTSNTGTWYNPVPTPTITHSKKSTIRKVTSTNPTPAEHSEGYYSFFKGLENGFKHIPWPKNDVSVFTSSDFLNGFKYIPNYISQSEHDRFLSQVLEYANTSNKVMHFDGRIVLNEMESDFYPLFFNRLVNDGFMEKSEKLPPNIYGPGDGIPAHFDSITFVITLRHRFDVKFRYCTR